MVFWRGERSQGPFCLIRKETRAMTNETCHQGVGYHKSDPSDKVRGRLHSRRRRLTRAFISFLSFEKGAINAPTNILNIEIDQNRMAI